MTLAFEEISRKLLHLVALLIPIALLYGDAWRLPKGALPGILGVLLVGSVIVEILRFRIPAVQTLFYKCLGSMLRKEERSKTTGVSWLIGSALICSLVFAQHPNISFMALSLFILGDAAAALVGISLGRTKIGNKSLEGSCACFLLCVILFYVAFPFVPGLLDPWGNKLPLALVLGTAFAITLLELVPLKITGSLVINDNLAAPVIAGFVMWGLERIVL